MIRVIDVPPEIEGHPLIASVSGGKDSTALMLALREAGLAFRAVFADTVWEDEETYAYLDLLRRRVGPIDVVGAPGGMRAKIRDGARFPGRTQRWCTRELKLEPLHAYHREVSGLPPCKLPRPRTEDGVESSPGTEHLLDTVSAVGIRADESDDRALMNVLDDDVWWGGYVWRPLLRWTVDDVLAIHHRHGIPVNPLYQRGHDRVGCYPCVYASKEEIRLIAEHRPERIDEIRELEVHVSAVRARRNAEHVPTERRPVRYRHEEASFFQGREGSPLGIAPGIDRVVEWSRTKRGGRELPVLAAQPSGGCFRWGLCEPPERMEERQMKVIDQVVTDRFAAYHGDCVDVLRGLPEASAHYSIFSPPFASLYTYSASPRDLGNVASHDEFYESMRFVADELVRVMKPGRLVSMHCMLLPTSKSRDGHIGLTDFRGELIRIAERAGFYFHSEVTIWKDPVTAMQRTKALGLLHKQIKKDSAMSRQGIPDYLVTFRKPGENPEPVSHSGEAGDMPVEVWQRYASPVWVTTRGVDDEGFAICTGETDPNDPASSINPSDTLQYRSAREHDDEKHVCPLQLEVIRRALTLWTNPGDTVLTPFGGIGSEGVVSLEMGRRVVLAELKRSYFDSQVANLRAAVRDAGRQRSIFDLLEGSAP